MAALPYMPLFVADYLADTAHLSAIEHGAYLLLIMNYWQRGKPLPSDDQRLSRIARVTPEEWAAIRPVLSEFFAHADGIWVHGRIEVELDKVRDKSAKAQAAGKRSATARARGVEQLVNVRSTDVQPTFNHTDTDTDTEEVSVSVGSKDPPETSSAEADPCSPKPKAKKAYSEQFETFWRAYPTDRNQSKAEAFTAWLRITPQERALAIEACEPYRRWLAEKPDRPVIHACRFLSKRRFEGHAAPAAEAATGPPVEVVPDFATIDERNAWLAERAREILKRVNGDDGAGIRGEGGEGDRRAALQS